MNSNQQAELLRIIGRAANELADVLDGTQQPASPAAPGGPALQAWEAKRVKYLQSFVDAGGTLTLGQVRAAAKAAGVGNPGSVTSHGYVEKSGPNERTISAKGKEWLELRQP